MAEPAPLSDAVLPIELEAPGDAFGVEAVVAAAFGPGRFAKTAERLREASRPITGFVARQGGRVVATVRLWPVVVGGVDVAFLGPIAVDASLRSSGIGADLVEHAHGAARELGLPAVLLVGDPPYFSRFGYVQATGAVLPGPVDPRRVLVKALTPAGEGLAGPVRRA
ncbi:MAG TPA: N-acetyltransferase [Caulobacteraceae bacterium]|nr:N-acetyltransferase [Caulobacteraceae bacterium]